MREHKILSVKINIPWRNIRYLILWLIPVAFWTVLAFTQPLWSSFTRGWFENLSQELGQVLPFDVPLGWMPPYELMWLVEPLDQPLIGAFQFFIVWSLVVFLLWAYGLPSPERPYLRTRVRYLLLWVVGLIVLIAWSGVAIRTIVPRAAPQLTMLTGLGPLLAIWSAIVFLLFLYIGDGSDAHDTYLGQYQGIWTGLALVILSMFLTGYFGYQSVRERAEGLLATRTLAIETVKELPWWTNRAEGSSRELLNIMNRYKYRTYELEVPQEFGAPLEFQPGDSQKLDSRNVLLDELSNKLPEVNYYAKGAQTKAQSALEQINRAIENEQQLKEEGTGTSLIQIQQVISTVVASTASTMSTLDAIGKEIELVRTDPEKSLDDLMTIVGNDLIVPADAANDMSGVAYQTIEAVGVTVLATFLWIGVFYATFVLFPWLLLLLFLFRKRDDRAAQIYDDLILLDWDENLLKRVLPSRPSGRRRQKEVVINELASQAFSNFEYILSLLLLSVITAVGWYYFFYPQTSLGLALLMQKGSGIKALTAYLVNDISPLTLGFAGAYFYLMQMLYRRYRDADLYPMAFLQASERLLRVFILSLVLSIFAPLANWVSAVTAVFAFMAGIYPRAGLRQIAAYINRETQSDFPETVETAPLTQLDGLNIWHEARLLDENVENIAGMANAPIERLILRTHFPTTQIVDWIDQATLYKHAGHRGEWFPLFRAAGIRTATDLLDRAGLSLLNSGDLQKLRDDTFKPDPKSLDRIVAAVNTAQDWRVSTPGDSREAAGAAATAFSQSVVDVADTASQAHTLAQTIEKEKRETYDYVFALNQKMAAALEATQKACAAMNLIAEADQQLSVGDDQKARFKRATDKIRESMGKVVPLAEQIVQLAQPMTCRPDTLVKLDEVKRQTDEWVAVLTATGTQAKVVLDFARQLAEREETKSVADAFLEKAAVAQDVLATAQEATKQARQQALSLNVDRPETLDALQKLKTLVTQLQELAAKLMEDQVAVEKAAKALMVQETQKSALISAMKKAAEVVDRLKKTAAQAYEAAQPLKADDASTLEGLSQSQKAIQEVYEASQETQSVVEAAVAGVQTACRPPRLTTDILASICDCIWPDNNMSYVVNFYFQTGKRLIAGIPNRRAR
jgi:hypothetical protein